MNQTNRVKLLEQQLTIFAQEFHDRMDLEDGLRQEIVAVRTVLLEQLAELRDVYLMHKRHLQETIELIDMVRRLAEQLDLHVAKGQVVIRSPEAEAWYKATKLMAKQSAKTLMRQKREIAPYLDENWKPPSPETWAGLVEQVVVKAETKPAEIKPEIRPRAERSGKTAQAASRPSKAPARQNKVA